MNISVGYNMDPLDSRESEIWHFIMARQALLTRFDQHVNIHSSLSVFLGRLQERWGQTLQCGLLQQGQG